MKAKTDPKVKLTLTVKKSVIESAKTFAAQQGTSVSRLIEDHLSKLPATKKEDAKKPMSIADQLFGCASGGPMSHMTDEEIKDMYVKDKFGL